VWSTRLEKLRQRCAVVDRLVDRQAAALRKAGAARLADPDSIEALRAFEGAEERYVLARMSQRKAHRALHRAEAIGHVFRVLTPGRPIH
jgi:hypothetical protein